MKQVRIMAIGAHAGDMELTCGGVLAGYARNGDSVTLVHMTAGEKGHPVLSDRDYREQKVKEAEAFAGKIGAKSIVLDYRDGELPDTDDVKYHVCDLIREYKPDILITHWKHSIHKDHAATYRIVQDAYFYAAIKSFSRELPSHGVQGLYYAENWEDPHDFQPYVYIGIDDASYKLWMEAVASYEFVVKSPYFKYLEYYSALSVVRGAQCRKPHAEAFAVDPLSMKQVFDFFPVK
jgi:LmbE family N-acetylglucosaminyl deacetylase